MLNMGKSDRTLRVIGAIILAVLAATGVLTGTLATVAWIVAAVLLVTSLIGFCPAYKLIGLDTRKKG